MEAASRIRHSKVSGGVERSEVQEDRVSRDVLQT